MASASPVSSSASARLPARLLDAAYVRSVLGDVFGSPDVMENDSNDSISNQAMTLGSLFDALLSSTPWIETILGERMNARTPVEPLTEGREDSRFVSAGEFRWVHVLRMLAMIERGVPIAHSGVVDLNGEEFNAGVLRELHLAAVDRLIVWTDAKTIDAEAPQPSIVSMSSALMDAFLIAGYLDSDAPAATPFTVNDQISALQVAIQSGNPGVTQSLLDFGVDLKRLPTKPIEFNTAGLPRVRVESGDLAGFLDCCSVHQPHTVALAREALMIQHIRCLSSTPTEHAATRPSATRTARMGL